MASKQIKLTKIFDKDGMLTKFGFKQGYIHQEFGRKRIWFKAGIYFVKLFANNELKSFEAYVDIQAAIKVYRNW